MPASDVDVNVHPSKREVRFARPDDVARLLTTALQDALSAADLPASSGPRSLEVEVDGEPNVTPTRSMISEPPATYRPFAPSHALDLGPLFRYFGQYDRTYLVAEVDGELRVIDQHAAHERVLYERLVAEHAGGTSVSQPLLIPETCAYPPDQALAIRARLDVLREAGIDIEPFGANTFVVRAVPALLAGVQWRTLVREMVEDLADDAAMESREPRHRLLATAACHAAVKAHQRLDDETTVALLRDLVATPRNATCPHGRPVSLRFAPPDLERAFGRRG
jgi:DNA mismatch repair protein MutL